MRIRSVALILALCACFVLSGCPELSGGNTFTLHNQLDRERKIHELALTNESTATIIIGKKVGVNILPEPLASGESFTVRNLPDGEYRIDVLYRDPSGNYLDREWRTQVMEGGRTYDWFFVAENQVKCDGDFVISEPFQSIWQFLRGLARPRN